MTTKDELVSRIIELKYTIDNNNYETAAIENQLSEVDAEFKSFSAMNTHKSNSLLKNLIITFNVNNFSDFTVIFLSTTEKIRIIEFAGIDILMDEFNRLSEEDIKFYKNVDSLKIRDAGYRLFFESMTVEKGVYTILTISESVFFKPSKFHILADIVMDIIRSTNMSRDSVFNDLFEETTIGINSYIAAHKNESLNIYLFRFENIYDFFLKMGLEIIIELSETIKKKLNEVFGINTAVFRFSLSEYIVISSSDFLPVKNISDLNNCNILDFNYKGIVLQHRCIKIPYSNQSIYSVFEEIYKVTNG